MSAAFVTLPEPRLAGVAMAPHDMVPPGIGDVPVARVKCEVCQHKIDVELTSQLTLSTLEDDGYPCSNANEHLELTGSPDATMWPISGET
jgi:hypothetical protein